MEDLYIRESKHRNPWSFRIPLLLVLGAILGAYAYHEYGGHVRGKYTDPSAIYPMYTEAKPASVVPASGAALGESIEDSRRNAIVRAIEAVQPAVVSITVIQVRVQRITPFSMFFDDPFFRRFFPELEREYKYKVKGLGSGFIVNKEGYILTNEHVVRNAVKIAANLPDGRQFDAKLVDSDQALDIAVLKIDGKDLPFAKLGDSDNVIIGEWAIAIGNPLGYIREDARPTVTLGVISAVNRNIRPWEEKVFYNMIQTDAAINPGNSGGPLINALGEVIGVNTFIVTRGGGSEGIAFAIPINKTKEVMNEIARYGKVREFWTGITVQSIDHMIAQSLDLESTEGVIVAQIDPGSPGERAGLRTGDVITQVNGRKVKNKDEARSAFLGARVGDVYRLDIIRDGERIEIDLKLEEMPER